MCCAVIFRKSAAFFYFFDRSNRSVSGVPPSMRTYYNILFIILFERKGIDKNEKSVTIELTL